MKPTKILILGLFCLAMLTPYFCPHAARADTFQMSHTGYDQSIDQTTTPGSHTFRIYFGDERYTEWFVGVTYVETDHANASNGYAPAELSGSFSLGSARVWAKVYTWNGYNVTGEEECFHDWWMTFADPAEVNDTPAEANELSLDTLYGEYIQSNTDEDWGKFYVDSPGEVTIVVEAPASLDMVVDLYDDTAPSVSGFLAGADSYGLGGDETLVYNVPDAGWYYIRRYEYTAQYSLTDYYTSTVSFVSSNTCPTILFSEPSEDLYVLQGNDITITWDGTDPEEDATVSLGYDQDDVFDNGNHTWIALMQTEDGTYAWGTTGVTPGPYYVFGQIYDGYCSNHAFAAGTVTVLDPSGDYDADGYSNQIEEDSGTDPNSPDPPYGAGYDSATDSRQPYQMVTVDPQSRLIFAGGTFSVGVNYEPTSGDDTLTGMGLRIHYDSSKLTWNGFSDVLSNGLSVQDTNPQDDTTSDFDGDPTTDKYLQIAWLDFAENWPGAGTGFPLLLYRADFTVSGALGSGETSKLRFSASDTAAGHGFFAKPVDLEVSSFHLDVDGNGAAEALTDGLLVARYLFGFRGNELITGVVAPDATRTTAAAIEAFIADGVNDQMTDVDCNGISDALTDGMLIVRYLFDFSGGPLIDKAVPPDAGCGTAPEIESNIGMMVP